MAKKKRKNNSKSDYQVQFISKGKDYPHENFTRLYRSLFYDEKFRDLTPTAKEIYLAILLECKNGSLNKCLLPHSAYKKITDKGSFQKAKRQLIDNGFIEVICSRSTLSNVYILSDGWKYDSIPDKEIKYYTYEEHKQIINGIKSQTREQ